MATPSLAGWQQTLLRRVGAPVTPENLRFLNAWAQAEGGSASNNPFNTTEPLPGATSYNSVGVRNYSTPQQGLDATVRTLTGSIGNYGPILSALRSGTSAQAAAQAVAGSQWGTGSGVLRVLGDPVASASPSTPIPTTGATALPSVAALPKLTKMPTSLGPNFTSTILANVNKSPLALMNAITGTAERFKLSTPAAQLSAPDVKSATTPNGVTVEVQGKAHPQDIKAVQLAEHFIGVPYKWGGTSPSGFDCSGLLQYVWGKQGVSIPRTTYEQWDQGTPVAKNQLTPGDAVYFTGSDPMNGKPGHVGMYIGGGKFIEAPHTGADVRVSSLAGRGDYVGARSFS